MKIQNNVPIWQLSVGQFLSLLQESRTETDLSVTATVSNPEKRYVYGLSGLASLLNCSKVTAQKYKNSGRLEGCYFQIGRKLVFDADAIADKLKLSTRK